MNNTTPQQPTPKPSYGGIVFCLFLVSLLFPGGVYFAYSNVIQPLVVLNKARAWVETPAKILHLGTRSTSGGRSGGSTYIAIRYQYEFNNQTHASELFNPLNKITNSEYNVNNYKDYKSFYDAGEPITCWVNPANPTEAVIDRNPIFENLLWSNFIVFILLIGGLLCLLCVVLYFTKPEQLINGPVPSYFIAVPAVLTFVYSLFLLITLLPFLPWPWQTCLIFLPAFLLAILCYYRFSKSEP